MSQVIEAHGLCHWYGEGGARAQVLRDLSLRVAAGEVVFLLGPSGCGKTTLLTLVGALRAVQRGTLRVLGQDLTAAAEPQRIALRRRIGFVFQGHNLHRSLTAEQNVLMALLAGGQLREAGALSLARAMLASVGLAGHEAKRPDQLSSGQRQRVAVARALVADPPLILADEPTAALDSVTGVAAVGLLRRLARERGAAVLMVTHDPRVLHLADRVLAMEDGRIANGSTAEPCIVLS